jgi:hypothetical protein
MVALLVVFTMLSRDPMAWAGPAPLLVYLGIAATLGWAIRKYSAREAVNHPLAFGAYVAWSLVSSLFITTLALCTMDSRDWGTRNKDTGSKSTRSQKQEACHGDSAGHEG